MTCESYKYPAVALLGLGILRNQTRVTLWGLSKSKSWLTMYTRELSHKTDAKIALNLHFPCISKCILLCLHFLVNFYQHYFIQARAWRIKTIGKDQSMCSSISLSCGMNPLTLVSLFIETCNLLKKEITQYPIRSVKRSFLVCVLRYYFHKLILSLYWHWDTITQQVTLNSLWK